MIQGLLFSVRRCPYQAKVMKMLDRLNNRAVCAQMGICMVWIPVGVGEGWAARGPVQSKDSSFYMQCREGCGACCVAPSITTPIPGMPQGKPAGVACIHLTADKRCALFGKPERPAVCSRFMADPEVCGDSAEQAIEILSWWEQATAC